MFPIPWNFPFRKKNGDLSTIGDMIGSGGGGSDLPPHSASDAGKLLGVKLDGSLEWSDEVNSEIQTLTNNLSDEVKTRATLGAHNLFNRNLPSTVSGQSVLSIESNGLRIKSDVAGTFLYGQIENIGINPNTDYIFSADITITAGNSYISLQGVKDGVSTAIFNGDGVSGNYIKEFNSGDYDSYFLRLYSSRGSSVAGNILYDNLTIRLSSDSDPTYQPYAMTNRELTESLEYERIDLSDAAKGVCVITRIGNVKIMKLADFKNMAAGNNASFFTIPEKFRPLGSNAQTDLIMGNDAVRYRVTVGTTGSVTIYNYGSAIGTTAINGIGCIMYI